MNSPLTFRSLIVLLAVLSSLTYGHTAYGQNQQLAAMPLQGIVSEKPSEGQFVKVDQGYMVAYQETIPGTNITFEMIPLSGGEFDLGSPETEPGRSAAEGPQVKVKVAPIWFAKCEVTWEEYHSYLNQYAPFKELSTRRYRRNESEANEAEAGSNQSVLAEYLEEDPEVDGVTCPTPIYDPSFTFEAGEEDAQPAVTMTQYAAKQYTKWLSGITGNEYRLPSEVEWEYAARAGAKSAYSFGDDPNKLADFAWFAANSEKQTHGVGTKQPNAWGLYDMHGNAAEWVLDAYTDNYDAVQKLSKAKSQPLVNWPTELYPRAIRGGCWYDSAEKLRAAARFASNDEDWTLSDPNLPVSPWWFTESESLGIGMRIVRQLEPLDEATKQLVWEADFEDLQYDIEDRMAEGRGVKAVANPKLPVAIKALEESAE